MASSVVLSIDYFALHYWVKRLLSIANMLLSTFSVRLDIIYFVENWKFNTKNTITKYFLLLKFTVHLQFALGWSMNNAIDPRRTQLTKT